MATLKGEAEELVSIPEACVGITRAMDDEGYETAGKDVKLKKKKVKSSPGMDDDGYETAGKKPLPRKQPSKDTKKDAKKTKTGPSADDASMSIDDHFQCEPGDEEDNVKKMISLIGSEVDCSGLCDEALKLLRLIPDGYVPLPHQVGGHRYLDGKPGFLRRIGQTKIFYKPVQPGSKGVIEVSFYESLSGAKICAGDPTMFRSLTESHHDESSRQEVDTLRELIPRYYGLETITDRLGVPPEYLVLEDLTATFSKPSILDLKLGKRVWDDFADQEKIDRELKKYPAQETLGFRIIGMRVYQPSKGTYQFYDRWFGRSVTNDTAMDAVAGFFNVDGRRRYDIITTLLVQLQKFEHWLQTQTRVRLFATSIIVVYEGSAIPSKVEVRLVDFAHTYDYHYGDTAGKPDGNPLFGLRSYISFLERLLE